MIYFKNIIYITLYVGFQLILEKIKKITKKKIKKRYNIQIMDILQIASSLDKMTDNIIILRLYNTSNYIILFGCCSENFSLVENVKHSELIKFKFKYAEIYIDENITLNFIKASTISVYSEGTMISFNKDPIHQRSMIYPRINTYDLLNISHSEISLDQYINIDGDDIPVIESKVQDDTTNINNRPRKSKGSSKLSKESSKTSKYKTSDINIEVVNEPPDVDFNIPSNVPEQLASLFFPVMGYLLQTSSQTTSQNTSEKSDLSKIIDTCKHVNDIMNIFSPKEDL